MVQKIGRNKNTNDEATVLAEVELNSSTDTVLLPANPNRIALHVNNNSSTRGVWIKLQPAGQDNDKKGIYLAERNRNPVPYNMTPDNIYTGEVCAIADSGSPSVYITEY